MSRPMPKRLEAFVQIRVEPRFMPGYVPTPEEAAEDAARRAEYDARRRESWRIYDAARPALDAIADPLARAILDLHSADTIEGPKCNGCDMDGYECEAPEWPCRTVEAVAAHYAIELPSASDLWWRP